MTGSFENEQVLGLPLPTSLPLLIRMVELQADLKFARHPRCR